MYNVDYFIEKFDAIPEEMWIIGRFERRGQKCASGHCGIRDQNEFDLNTEFLSLHKILKSLDITGECIYQYDNEYFQLIPIINDGNADQYKQPTPKQRILAALYDVKSLQAISEAQSIINEPKPENHEERMWREDRMEEILDGTREDFALNWKEGK